MPAWYALAKTPEEETTVSAAAVRLEGKALFLDVDQLHDPMGDPPFEGPEICRRFAW
ncbi:hypothetical protein RV134_290021 [Roseovarius sp. EC-HK134]|nr:hypothetical protein RV134_290021 [Roseovarius sp. EC-HK134]VVT17817.1 hypothetical protein RV420_360016 [Roseovarius sp. EC-SD190]